jgi:drug/metabolite transporter (DMT)-like permease
MAPAIQSRRERLLLLLAFASIYIIWGSTYLAIRFAVESIPPLIVAGLRHLTAGSVLLAWALARGYRPTRRELQSCAVLAVLFFLMGHGSLHWAETRVPSGLSALLVATEPILLALMGLFIAHDNKFTFLNVSGLAIGLIGVALLSTDKAALGGSYVGAVVILLGTVAWSFGMLYSRKVEMPRDPIARSALPMFFGSWMLLAAAAVSGEFKGLQASAFTWKATGGLLYLIVFGSIVAFTAYTWLLERTSPVFLATHTYVNPIVAVLLGWMLAGETLNGRVALAGAMVVLSVVFVSLPAKEAPGSRLPTPEDRAPEHQARSEAAD